MNVRDVVGHKTLPNGAVISRRAFDCEVCTHRSEEPEQSVYTVEYQGQKVELCIAHAQELVDSAEDSEKEGGLFEEVFQ